MKVCLLAAGKGSRMGDWTRHLNKVLLPIHSVPPVSRIINSFPTDTEFVFACGYQSDRLQEFCQLAHPETQIEFVQVDNFDGPGSGPGKSLLTCQEYLQEPFFLVCGDTLWNPAVETLNHDENWMGVAPVPTHLSTQFCLVECEGQTVVGLLDKPKKPVKSPLAFVGLFFIKDYEIFFESLQKPEMTRGEHQLASGFQQLITSQNLTALPLSSWVDVGTQEKWEAANEGCPNFCFCKEGTYFYKVGDKVLKFFSEPTLVDQRWRRGTTLKNFVPILDRKTTHFFSYVFQDGVTADRVMTENLFASLLNWLDQQLWDRNFDQTLPTQSVVDYYLNKTRCRIQDYKSQSHLLFAPSMVNNNRVAKPDDLIDRIQESLLATPWMGRFHGDLTLNNIVCSEDGGFTLIDWRHNFAGHLDVGDRLFDLAKLLMSLKIDFLAIKNNQYQVKLEGNAIIMDCPTPHYGESCTRILKDYCHNQNLNFESVELLSTLALFQMAPLHSPKVAQLLWSKALLDYDLLV